MVRINFLFDDGSGVGWGMGGGEGDVLSTRWCLQTEQEGDDDERTMTASDDDDTQ